MSSVPGLPERREGGPLRIISGPPPGPAPLAAALGGLADAVMLTSADTPFPGARIEWSNAAFEDVTGWSPDDACGRTVRVLLGAGTDRVVLDRLAASLEAGRPAREELLAYRREGSPFVMELSVSPLRDADGHTTTTSPCNATSRRSSTGSSSSSGGPAPIPSPVSATGACCSSSSAPTRRPASPSRSASS